MASTDRTTQRLRPEPLVRQPHPYVRARGRARRDDRRGRHPRRHVEPDDPREGAGRGEGYDEQLAELARAGMPTDEIYWELVLADIGAAADVLRPVYDDAGGGDGFVSVEVAPDRAHDTDSDGRAGRVAARAPRPAERAWSRSRRPSRGSRRSRRRSLAGIPVNVTLIFSLGRYDAVIEAYLDGARAARRRRRRPVDRPLGRVLLRQPRRHRSRPPPPRRQPAPRQGRRRQREGRVPAVPRAVLRPAVGRARGEGRAPATTALGVDVDEEPGVLRHAVRRRARRPRHREHARPERRSTPCATTATRSPTRSWRASPSAVTLIEGLADAGRRLRRRHRDDRAGGRRLVRPLVHRRPRHPRQARQGAPREP